MASKDAMQGQAQYGIATAASKLDCVQIDGLVVLKIIKHSRDEGNPNEMVSGQLLGMDITQNDTTTLEVEALRSLAELQFSVPSLVGCKGASYTRPPWAGVGCIDEIETGCACRPNLLLVMACVV